MVIKKILHHHDLLEWCWAAEDKLIPKPFFTSVFLLDGLLIDTGAPKGVQEFQAFVTPKIAKKEIFKCLITHTHEDHIGGAHIISEQSKIPIYASAIAISLLEDAHNYVYSEYRQLYWGSGLQSVKAQIIPDRILSSSGKYELRVVATPGHASDQIALIEPTQEWAFVADAILPKYRVLFGHSCTIQEDISQIYASIRRLYLATEGMNDLKTFVSGKGVFHGRKYLKDRMKEIKSLHSTVQTHKAQGLTPEQILEEIFGEEGIIGIMTGGELSHLNLINSLYQWNA
jgi:glyoxylase-like metal-dependent hydrolase (beta-lactamase superfamily II)